jgi:hypothetical protein
MFNWLNGDNNPQDDDGAGAPPILFAWGMLALLGVFGLCGLAVLCKYYANKHTSPMLPYYAPEPISPEVPEVQIIKEQRLETAKKKHSANQRFEFWRASEEGQAEINAAQSRAKRAALLLVPEDLQEQISSVAAFSIQALEGPPILFSKTLAQEADKHRMTEDSLLVLSARGSTNYQTIKN